MAFRRESVAVEKSISCKVWMKAKPKREKDSKWLELSKILKNPSFLGSYQNQFGVSSIFLTTAMDRFI